MNSAAQVIDQALKLPRSDRSYIASKIIESLDAGDLHSDWPQELENRFQRWESGESVPVSSDDLHSEIRSRLAM